ncbi:hypothetical protein OQA88_7757 [Cercophora sp. LCS_1]
MHSGRTRPAAPRQAEQPRTLKSDATRPWLGHVDGFARYAAFIAGDHDKSLAVYKRFDRLAHRVLIYYVARLSELEAELARLDQEDLVDADLSSCAKSLAELEATAEFFHVTTSEELSAMSKEQQERRVELAQKAEERLRLMDKLKQTL